MRIPRIYCPNVTATGRIELESRISSHLCKVLRLKQSDTVLLFDGKGHSYTGTLVDASPKKAILNITHAITEKTESKLKLHLGLAMSKGDRMDYAIQKAVEVGVTQITPLTTEFCVVRLDEKRQQKKNQHWQGIIINACEQSGRTHLPVLNPVSTLENWLALKADIKIVFSPDAHTSLHQLAHPNTVSLLVGPEGGLSPVEIELAEQHKFIATRLGPRTLRTETAAVVTCAALQTLWGDYK